MSARIRKLGLMALLLGLLLSAPAFASGPQQAMPPMDPMDMHHMPVQPKAPARQAAMHGATSKPASLPPNDHISPPPPRHAMPAMSPAKMADVMQMHDHATMGMLTFQRLESDFERHGGASTAWDAEGWWGGDIDRLWLESEGERGTDGTRDARVEALWGHAVASFWDTRLGVRHDFGQGPSRDWIAFGVEGLAPYWFEVNAMLYAGPRGRTAARVEVDYDLLFTQRLILRPALELNAYGKSDPRRSIRAGFSDAELGLRLRYEFSRRFAPYIGVTWTRRRGGRPVASPPWQRSEPGSEFAWLAGVRFWL